MFLRTLLVVSAILAGSGTVWAQAKVTLEVQPSTAEVSPWYTGLELRVILHNNGSEDLVRPRLTVFTNDSFQVKIEPAAVSRVRSLEATAWTARVDRLEGARIPGTIQFEASYTVPKVSGVQRAYAALAVKAQAGALDKPIELSVQGSFDAVTETRPGIGHLIVKNNLDVPAKVTAIKILRADAKSFGDPPKLDAFEIPPRSTQTRTVILPAAARVTPGRHVVIFSVVAEWDEGGHHHKRELMVEKEVTVGVFFESEVLKALSVPSFLLLPGCLFLFTMQLLVTLGVLGVNRYSKVPEVPVTSPGFWIVAVTFSGLFAWVYSYATGTDYLVRYGTGDLSKVWLCSIALGVVTFVLIALVTRHRRQQRVPDTTDDELATLEKMERRGRGILVNPVHFLMNNVDVTAFLLEPIEDGQPMVWVAPQIVTTWADTNEGHAAQAEVEGLINARATPGTIAERIRAAHDAEPRLVEVGSRTQNSVPNPYHLKVERITQYGAPEPLVTMN